MNKDSALEAKKKEIKKELKKKKKRRLKQEYADLIELQNALRLRIAKAEEAIAQMRSNEIIALRKEDKGQADICESIIAQYTEEYKRMTTRYKSNSEILKIYAEVLNCRSDSRIGLFNAITGAAGIAASAAIASVGLKKAYQSDIEGTMRNNKVFDWIKGLPIIRNFGSKR